ncbi:MAG TPA: copper amine oxidase N-terminal domain-containing protein [Acetivibrio clariflavus]|nr:copper amine oxidase N-terminal domain-containing protein [Acetivibrio clariflavus]
MKDIFLNLKRIVKNSKVLWSFFILLLFLFVFGKNGVQAKIINNEFVDLTFTIDSKDYLTRSIKKKMDIAPFIENGYTLVPFRTIFEELGYTVRWDDSERSIIAVKMGSQMKLYIDNNVAFVNGEQKVMTVAPKIVSGRTFVPLRFVSENAGANVVWDDAKKAIYITRVGKYETGGVLFYEKGKNNNNMVYVYDGNDFKVIPLNNKSIVNWYSYKGRILLTMFDSTTSKNNFAQYKDGRFEILINDFDIQETFEYNNNLLIHGYDREQKFNKLYRFDGESLTLIENNFYVGKHIEVNGKLLVNKYDNTRNYTLLVFDKNSSNPWTPKVLSDDFIIKDYVIFDNVVYMTGVLETGKDKPLASYNSFGTDKSYFEILLGDTDININDLAVCRNEIYIVKSGKLYKLTNSGLDKVLFEYRKNVYIEYSVTKIIAYKDKLYVAVKGGSYIDSNGKTVKEDYPKISSFVMEYENTASTRVFIKDFTLKEFRIESDILLSLGTIGSSKDSALYIYNGVNDPTFTLDVLSIKNTLSVNNKLFIDVTDKSRITDKQRDTMLIYEGNTIRNLVVDMKTKYWDSVRDSLVFSGYEAGINANKLYSYGYAFNELLGNFDVKYWNKIEDTLFVCGSSPLDKKFEIYKFNNANKIALQDNLEIIKVIKAKENYYLIYAYDRDNQSPLKGKKILYIYDDSTRDFIEMKVNMEISDMIFMQ